MLEWELDYSFFHQLIFKKLFNISNPHTRWQYNTGKKEMHHYLNMEMMVDLKNDKP